jgi:hypothetical protein
MFSTQKEPEGVRSLTSAEARVVGSILASGLESDVDRMRSSGLPKSTYRDAKRRLFGEGFLESRFVPNPTAIGVPRISLLLTRPYAEGMSSVTDELADLPGTVVLWSGHQVVFAVVFHRSIESSSEFVRKVSDGKLGNVSSMVSVDVTQQPILAYFDIEGSWSSLCGFKGTRYYPRKLPPVQLRHDVLESPGSTMPSRITKLLGLPFSAEKESVPSHLVGPTLVPWSQRRCLRRGEVEWRVFPSMTHLHLLRFRGLNFSNVLFIVGKLKQAGGMPDLFRDLASKCGVNPFLAAGDDSSVIIAGVSISQELTKDPSAVVFPRRHVIPTIGNHITNIELFREPLTSLRVHLSHRYDRLVW